MQQMIARRPNRSDPAPSRWSYRLQRLMLTPLFRTACRVGIPMALTFGAVTFFLADAERREALNLMVADIRHQIETRPEFMVHLMEVDGAGASVSEDIREIVPIDFPVSSFDLDLDGIQKITASLDAVKSAAVRIRPGGTLQIQVTERVPALIWRTGDGLELLDTEGVSVGPLAARALRADLPLIAGVGADGQVVQALRVLAAAAPLRDRVRGLERIGERRWDVVLDRGQRILLPETRPVTALERVIAMDKAQDMLARDLALVDLRLSDRPTLRLTDQAVEELWRIKTVVVEEQ